MPEEPKYNRLPAGRRVGKYEVQAHIADGGMAAVYRAMDTDLGRVVALKVLPPELADKPSMLDRFRREARAAAKLQHKNIVAVYDVGESGGLNYLALEYVDGITLEKYILRRGRMPPEEARQVLLQVARALAHAHTQGIVHRDIKPSNLLLSAKDKRLTVKLADLGLAIQLQKDDDFRMTKAGMTVGTIDYMAPEQARDSSSVDTRSDIYSLGCTLYHMLAGTAPFPKGSLTERLIQHLEADPPDVRKLNKDVPPPLAAVLRRMLAKRPADRYQTPADLLKALEALGPLKPPAGRDGGSETIAEAGGLRPTAPRPAPVPVVEPTVFVDAPPAHIAPKPPPRPPRRPAPPAADMIPLVDDPERTEDELPVSLDPERTENALPLVPDEAIADETPAAAPSRRSKKTHRRKERPRPGPAADAPLEDDAPADEMEPAREVPDDDDAPDERPVKPAARRKRPPEPEPVADVTEDESADDEDARPAPAAEVHDDRRVRSIYKKKPRRSDAAPPVEDDAPADEAPAPAPAAAPDDSADHPAPAPVVAASSAPTYRDPDDGDDEDYGPPESSIEAPAVAKRKWQMPILPWWLYAAGGGLLLLLALPLIAMILPERRPVKKDDDPAVPTPIVVVPSEKKDDEPGPVVLVPTKKGDEEKKGEKTGPKQVIDTSPAKMTADWPLASLPGPMAEATRAVLRRDFLGPFAAAAEGKDSATVVRVSRTAAPGPAAFRTLAEALAATDGEAVIEIHDQGPIVLPALPAVDGKRVVLRAGAGFRPLLAWEPTAADKTAALLTVANGRLTLDGLDVVARFAEIVTGEPALFDLRASDFRADGCTFSVAGKVPQGVAVVRLRRSDAAPAKATCRLTTCFARGPDLTAVRVDGLPAEVLVDRSLLIGARPPLFLARGDGDDVTLRLIRSTLVTGDRLVEVRPADPTGNAPRLKGHALDTVFARNDPGTADGDLLHLAAGADLGLTSWRATNCVYAGWQQLLDAPGKKIAGKDLDAWQKQWLHHDGEAVAEETWPSALPAGVAELPADRFAPYDAPVEYAARSASGAIGSPVGALPPAPADWVQRVYDPRPLVAADVSPTADVPEIDPAVDKLYPGERIDLSKTKVDLGQYLQPKLQPGRAAKRVVLHLAGSGAVPTSPIRARGVEQLIVYMEPSKDPLTLVVDPRTAGRAAALIEVEQGTLELLNVRVRCENSGVAVVPPYLVKAQGGDLLLSRCRLTGPLDQAPPGYLGLIHHTGPAEPADRPAVLGLYENVLLSGKGLVTLAGANVQVQARYNVGLALGDAVQVDLASRPAAGITCLFDQNTWAIRQSLLTVTDRPDAPPTASPVVTVQAVGNYFVDPFGGASKATLVRAPASIIPRGALLWRGSDNAFDARLGTFFAAAGTDAAKQTLADWHRLWGPAREKKALPVDAGPDARAVDPADPQLLGRLALPSGVRGDPGRPPPGADLARLGVGKKG